VVCNITSSLHEVSLYSMQVYMFAVLSNQRQICRHRYSNRSLKYVFYYLSKLLWPNVVFLNSYRQWATMH